MTLKTLLFPFLSPHFGRFPNFRECQNSLGCLQKYRFLGFVLNASNVVGLGAGLAPRQAGAPGQDCLFVCLFVCFVGEAKHFESLQNHVSTILLAQSHVIL